MKQPILTQLLSNFDRSDLENWREYLVSPFFRVPEKLRLLGLHLHEHWPDFSPDTCGKLAIQSLLFDSVNPSESQKIYDAFSQLYKLTLQFLAHHHLQKHPQHFVHVQLEELSKKNAAAQVEKLYRESHAQQQDHFIGESKDALIQLLSAQQATEWFARQQQRHHDSSRVDVLNATDQYYLLTRLKYSCEWLNRRNILPAEAGPDPMQHLPDLERWSSTLRSLPLIRMYESVLGMLREDDREAFRTLVQLLAQYDAQISVNEASALFAYAQNFCIRMVNSGEQQYLEDLFMLYGETLRLDLLHENGQLDHRQYKNIVTVGLRLQKFDWVGTFLETYREELPDQYRNNAYLYNLASLRYAEQRYGEALSLLQEVNFTDVYYHLSAKTMMLKIYFEREEDEALEHLLVTFRMFLQRNKEVSTYQRDIHLNLVRFTKKLYQLRLSSFRLQAEESGKRLAKLQQQLAETKNVANVSWLEEQVGRMIELLSF
ncbi:MAG: hypothetical protein NWR72_11560 [Bacteroidia bacterium]|nr:hypothetical protein [Bacteroidia bacterium]